MTLPKLAIEAAKQYQIVKKNSDREKSVKHLYFYAGQLSVYSQIIMAITELSTVELGLEFIEKYWSETSNEALTATECGCYPCDSCSGKDNCKISDC
jgi:hypothetical protein